MDNDDFKQTLIEIEAYIEMSRYEQALQKLKPLLSSNPNNGRILYYLCLCYYNLDQNEDALEAGYASLSTGFIPSEIHYLLGCIYRNSSKYKQAEEHYLESIRINPKKAIALSGYGILLLKMGNDKKAIQLINEALQIAPTNEIVLSHLLKYNLSKKKKKSQFAALQKYISNESNEVYKLANIGIFNMNNKNYPLAKENFRQAYLLDPTNKDILRLLEEMDILTHWFFFPNRLIEKAGGAGVVYLVFVLTFFLTLGIKNDAVHWTILILDISFVLYTYLARFVYMFFKKIRRTT